jgi:hypothetical protein
MRTLFIQENGRHDKNRKYRECFAWQRAFQTIGHTCDVWGAGHSNYEAVPDFDSYDVIHNLENYDETGWLPDLSKVKARKFLHSVDAHVRGLDPFLEEYKRGDYEVILQAIPDFVEANSIWFPVSFDHTLVKPMSIEKTNDLGFCGNINNRGNLINILDEAYGIKKDIFLIGDDMVSAINSYKIHFNCNVGVDINWRNLETIGCGTALLTNYHPTYDRYGFMHGENCVFYTSIPEMLKGVEYLLNNPEDRERIAKNGLELSQRHTYLERAKYFNEVIL